MGTFFYMLLAFLVGVLVGWFLWGRMRGELDSLRGDMDRTRSERDRLRADSDRLTGELEACGRTRADLERRLSEAPAAAAKPGPAKAASQAPAALTSTPAAAKSAPPKPAPAKPAAPKPAAPKPAVAKPAAAKPAPAKPAAAKAVAAPKVAAPKAAAPKASAAPKKAAPAAKKAAPATGKADNLRRLIGIGPVNEKLLKGLGFTTYAQIAGWTAADVKRIEDVLNFDGRIAREQWIEQAKLLAAGNEKEFARLFPTAGTASNT
ncbi:proton-conducting membrane transporter [Mesorhizobium sp. AR10]|uniref:proton-conducting membrane transporter n=1 Tax=Mesorhizobium sp. AR10 TaxID=2865839 RepID=UPI0021603776|nr:proton-conducting membrane transporter [Mesorhizobium sp. AR10]UVK40677.1 proton-conducting membrane transporter [Mesorhizobium sp. AR10]